MAKDIHDEAKENLEMYFEMVIRGASNMLQHALAGRATLGVTMSKPPQQRYDFAGVELADMKGLLKNQADLLKWARQWETLARSHTSKLPAEKKKS